MKITMEIRKLIEKADKALEVAEELFENEHPSDAVSKTLLCYVLCCSGALEVRRD